MRKLLLLLLLSTPLAGLAMTPVGTPVKKIVFASGIDGWQAVDQRRLILSASANEHYLVTLSRDCHLLPFAHSVGISTSNNAVYSGFDHITVDGIRFGIKAIVQVTRAEVRALTKA